MDTFRQVGERITYSNSGSALSAGDVVVLGTMLGVCITDIAASTGVGEISVSGVHELPATAAESWNQGVQLHWNATTGKLTAVGYSVHKPAGRAAAAKAGSATTALVVLNSNAVAASAVTTAAPTTTAPTTGD